MLRVTVELWPHGHEYGKQTLGVVDIWNDGTSKHPARGNYGARAYAKGSKRVTRVESQAITDYPRQALPVWCLVRRALGKLGYL